jgi:superfamily II DNA/RNA helicase
MSNTPQADLSPSGASYDEDYSPPTFPSSTSVGVGASASDGTQDAASSDAPPEFKNWEDVDEISADLLRGIYAYGFEKPSHIQQKSILSIIQKRDVIAQAQSGTGKTGAFTVAALQSVDVEKKTTQVLILAPTRELAKQIYDVISSIDR